MSKYRTVKIKDNSLITFHHRQIPDFRAIAFLLKGVRTNKPLIALDLFEVSSSFTDLVNYLKSNSKLKLDRVIIYYRDSITKTTENTVRKKLSNLNFKTIIFINVNKWIKQNYTSSQISWIKNALETAMNSEKFPIRAAGMLMDKKLMEDEIIEKEKELDKLNDRLSNLKTEESSKLTSIKNIRNMKWIKSIQNEGNGLLIKNNPIPCSFTENIGFVIPFHYIQRNNVLYRMMKYQLLGKHFIVLPDEYIIDCDFNITGNRVNYTDNVSRFIAANTYFHGMACHIGNGHACLGELAGPISMAYQTGLDTLLYSMEAYLKTINLLDTAGQKFYALPMGNKKGEIEVWPYLELMASKYNIPLKDFNRNIEGYNSLIEELIERGMDLSSGRIWDGYPNITYEKEQKENMEKCLELIKYREPKIYEIIIKNGGHLQWQ